LTHKLLGKRAEVSLIGDAPVIAAAKNKALNWGILGISFFMAAMFFALVPLFYFYPPETIWSFVIFRPDPKLASSLHWIYTVCVLIIFLDIAVIRHFWCRFACIYRVWQHSFKTRQTLHVAYDASRADECLKCGYCVTTCFVELDPRKTDIYDSCINCGECIDACNNLHAKTGGNGLLRFHIGEREQRKLRAFRDNTMSLLSRLSWTVPFSVLGAVMFAWGIFSYAPYHMSVGKIADVANSAQSNYRNAIANKRYAPSELAIRIEGLPPSEFHLSAPEVQLDPVGRTSITLSIARNLHPGLYPIVVEVRAQDGWVGRFNIQHFAG
jgi:polyferredoxin